MFEDSTFESTGRIKTRSRRWMIAALGLNGSVVVALILIPLIYPEALSNIRPLILMEAPRPPATQPPRPKLPEQRFHGTSEMSSTQLVVPTEPPTHIVMVDDHGGPPPDGKIADLGQGESFPGALGNAFPGPNAVPVVRSAPKGPNIVSSGVMTGRLIYKVTPLYPPMGRAVRVEGTVVLQAIISKTGTIENLRVESGPPLLQQAAIDAVKQWRYRPYLLDGQTVEVETTINVVFTLSK